ncbi:MAG: FTR1 family protein [Rickettsiales bacterium]|nr:FTR1 family protein [Rickettsiales bacterium]
MEQIAIVIFRETLEIALILGILSAATKEIKGRFKYILGGLVAGVGLSIILALFTDSISSSLNGMGQEIFNGTILLLAAIMISATILWMKKHSKSLSGNIKNLSKKVQEGEKAPIALLIVVLLSVLREGAEIVLFTYSYYISGSSIMEISVGLLVGIICGIITGIAFYLGILKLSGRYFFKVTTILLVFVTAGIAMQSVNFFTNADIISPLIDPVFDLSSILSQTSIIGKFLNIFFGYVDSPTLSQLLAYFGVIFGLMFGLKKIK